MLKGLITVCLSFLLWLSSAWISLPVLPNHVMAATVSEEVETAVDEFLNNIPRDYYTVKEVDEIKRLVREKNAQLIDVREPLEYATGHILNAINIPLRELANKQDQIATDRPVIVYCAVGYRTAMGVETLHLLGYNNVLGYPGSVQGWKAAGESLQ